MFPNPDTWHALANGTRRGPLAALARAGLRLLSGPYSLSERARNVFFDRGWKRSHRAAVPVVSVGNLTLGGTGKTPCVEYVAALCRDRLNRRPVILSRGYGRRAGHNDEAMVLEENLPDVPHLQGADRVALAATAVDELEAEVLVLDDGFQHRRLQRDLDIVLLDATRPLSRENLFPRGMLREPVSSLRRAHMAVFTRCDQAGDVDSQIAWLKRYSSLPVATSVHRPVEWQTTTDPLPLESFAGRPVAAFCGLGNPEAFRTTLRSLNLQPQAFRTFPDHHNYTREDVESLTRWAGEQPADAAILTTQKDWVKLRVAEFAGRPLAALRIGLVLTSGEDTLVQLLEDRIGVLEPTE